MMRTFWIGHTQVAVGRLLSRPRTVYAVTRGYGVTMRLLAVRTFGVLVIAY